MFDIFNTVFKYKEKSSPDKLGYYPERVHIKAMPERRYLWSSRLLVIAAIFSICLNMSLAATIYLLLPMKRAAPRLMYLNPIFNQMQLLEPSEIRTSVFDLISEKQVREYIKYRYLIGAYYDELVARWAPGSIIYWTSSPKVFQDFQTREAQEGLDLKRLKGLIRLVEIDWVSQITNNVWQAQFRTLDYYPPSKKPDVSIWRATLRIGYAKLEFTDRSYALFNPYGFLVLNYSLAYRGKNVSSEHYLDEIRKAAKNRAN